MKKAKESLAYVSHLMELEDQKVEIEQTIIRFGEIISGKVFANLMSYISDLPNTWQQDSETLSPNS
jgi:hypothetical protein